MQFLIELSIRPDADPATVKNARVGSSKVLWELYVGGMVRSMYSRGDNKGIVLLIEAPDAATAGTALAKIPLIQAGQITGAVTELRPFPDIALAFAA